MKTINLLIIALLICTSAVAQDKKENKSDKTYSSHSNSNTEYFGDLIVRKYPAFNSVCYSLKSIEDAFYAQYPKQDTVPRKVLTKREADAGVSKHIREQRAVRMSLDSDKPVRDAFKNALSKNDIKSLTVDIKIEFKVNQKGDIVILDIKSKPALYPNITVDDIAKLGHKTLIKLLKEIAKVKFNVLTMAQKEFDSHMYISVDALKTDGEVLIYRNQWTKEKTLSFGYVS